MIDHIKKYKIRIIFEGLVILVFATADLTPQNYFLLLGLFVISIIDFHAHQRINHRERVVSELFDREKNKTAIRIIQDLASEIVYPTKSEQWKSGLLDAVQELKDEVLRD